MKSKSPSWQGKATVRPRRQGRRGVAFTGAKRKPLTEGAGGSGAGLARKGKAKGGTRSGKSQGDCETNCTVPGIDHSRVRAFPCGEWCFCRCGCAACGLAQLPEATVAKRLSRKELYELVWSEPMKILAPRFGISDVALRKTCARAEIPTPGPGHWAKKTAGKNTSQEAFPERPPGMELWVPRLISTSILPLTGFSVVCPLFFLLVR